MTEFRVTKERDRPRNEQFKRERLDYVEANFEN